MIRARILAALLLTALPACAQAGAWTLPDGAGQAIVTLRRAEYDRFVDAGGSGFDAPDYRKWELNPYLEYGLNADTTVGGSLFLVHAVQELATGGQVTSAGVGDSEWFLRRRLWHSERAVVSVQPLVMLPSPIKTAKFPSLGSDAAAYELRLLGGLSFDAFDHPAYINTEAAYRMRNGRSGDQWRYQASAGVTLAPRWQGIVQIDGTQAAHGIGAAFAGIDDANDYDLVNLQVSGVYRLTDRLGVQLGLWRTLHARNTGEGTGLLAALWVGF